MGDLITRLGVPEGYRSVVVARFLWQMDEQRDLLLAGVRGLTAADLEWQPAPGMNTIGMLLAHIAYAEAHLGQVGLLGETVGHAEDVIGLSEEQEGLPLAPGAPPSPALAGRALGDFEDMLSRAREHTQRIARALEDADLDREVVRPRPDGTRRVFNVGWVFYHLLEHEAGHRGQIGVLKHLRRLRPGG